MADYISREAVLEKMETWVCCSEGEREGLELTKKFLKNFPSADVVEVVRCKDCKHYVSEDYNCLMMDTGGWMYYPDDFCSRAERRTDE